MEVGVGAVDLDCLVPRNRLEAELWLPVELDERGLVFVIDETEGVYTEPLHETEGSWDGAVGHDPHDHVHAFRRKADEIPEVVVGGLRLGEGPVRLLLCGMY